ncbi:MAG: hypothetical protein ACI837_002344 [Crocinitomicaceae bacterium]|jgi:hypothetical protein
MNFTIIYYFSISSLIILSISSCKQRDASDLAANGDTAIIFHGETPKYAPEDEIHSFESDKEALFLIGDWEAVSNNHVAICGDMNIDTTLISFEKKDCANFQIWYKTDEEWILKISKDVDAGQYMRIGPVVSAHRRYSQMEVAYYGTQEDAMAERNFPSENASSWGIYTRKM